MPLLMLLLGAAVPQPSWAQSDIWNCSKCGRRVWDSDSGRPRPTACPYCSGGGSGGLTMPSGGTLRQQVGMQVAGSILNGILSGLEAADQQAAAARAAAAEQARLAELARQEQLHREKLERKQLAGRLRERWDTADGDPFTALADLFEGPPMSDSDIVDLSKVTDFTPRIPGEADHATAPFNDAAARPLQLAAAVPRSDGPDLNRKLTFTPVAEMSLEDIEAEQVRLAAEIEQTRINARRLAQTHQSEQEQRAEWDARLAEADVQFKKDCGALLSWCAARGLADRAEFLAGLNLRPDDVKRMEAFLDRAREFGTTVSFRDFASDPAIKDGLKLLIDMGLGDKAFEDRYTKLFGKAAFKSLSTFKDLAEFTVSSGHTLTATTLSVQRTGQLDENLKLHAQANESTRFRLEQLLQRKKELEQAAAGRAAEKRKF